MAASPRKWVFFIPILAGIAAVVLLKQQQAAPVQAAATERPRPVRVIAAPALPIRPYALGYGTVRPLRTWEAVAQVKGKVVERNPELRRGAILSAGTLLLRIDPSDYRLALTQTEAELEAARAQLQELDAREENSRASLQIEEAALALSRNELQRKRSLLGKGGVSASDLEAQQRLLLTQEQGVQAQRSSLNLLPAQRAGSAAQVVRLEARLAVAQRDLERTEIRLPFTGRVAETGVESDQYVREGAVLAQVDDLAKAEVEVQLPVDRFAALIRRSESEAAAVPASRELPAALEAEVRLREGLVTRTWHGRVTRLADTLDAKTRTLGVIVEVDAPYAEVTPGVAPPLVKGMFVEAALYGAPLPAAVIVPRTALHEGRLYLAGEGDRLTIRPVTVALWQPGYAVIADGLRAGERVVVSDLTPAIDGRLLAPQPDERVLERLREQAAALPEHTGAALP